MEKPNCKHFEVCGLYADADPEASLCILHSEDPEKDKQAFGEALETHRRERGDNFRFFVFPDAAYFKQTKFEGKADFRDATFLGRASFLRTHFSGSVSFENVVFLGKVFFSFIEFWGDVDFTQTKFSGPADFTDSKFLKKVSFELAQFSKRAEFALAVFKNEVTFGNVYSIFTKGATFHDESNFASTSFYEEAFFDKVEFIGPARFEDAKSQKTVSFRDAKFASVTSFAKVAFHEVDYQSAKFSAEVHFQKANIVKNAEFQRATFSAAVDFQRARFSGVANFTAATFLGETKFMATGFNRSLSFNQSSFSGRTMFVGGMTRKKQTPIFSGAEVDFKNVHVDPPDTLIFRDADLSRCLFQGTRLQEFEFTGVEWTLIRGRFTFKRFGVYDEIAPTGADTENDNLEEQNKIGRPWPHIERLYRDLKKNYEDQGDHERAGHFHYGEKEMRRNNPQTAPMLRFFLSVYWLISGYGERYLLPVFCAAVLLVFCTVGYLALGIAPEKEPDLVLKWANLKDWVSALRYSLDVMLLQKPEDLKPISSAAGFLKTIQSVAGPFILALFALALRQWLKR
jgi:uncharacterized protein YjbI with pentapeptide repeats